MGFQMIYAKVQGIVLRCYRDYHLNSWELVDWEQEGMLVLHELLERYPELGGSDYDLFRYFKTKFRNHILDKIRRQESEKRKFDKPQYQEVSEIGHKLKERGLSLDDLVLFRCAMRGYKKSLSREALKKYELILEGKSFRGKQSMLRELAEYFHDFNPYT